MGVCLHLGMLPEASQGLTAVSYGRYKDVSEAVELIDELLEVGFRRVDCLHQLILANLKLGNYTKAKETLEIGSQRSSEAQEAADVWLHLEPDNGLERVLTQGVARMLHSVVLERASHDGWLGFYGLTLVATGALNTFLKCIECQACC